MKCPVCNFEIADGSKFCVHCGTKIELDEKAAAAPMQSAAYCKACGTQLKQGAKFCPKCGAKQDGAEGEEKAAPMRGAGVDLKKPATHATGERAEKPAVQEAGGNAGKPKAQEAGGNAEKPKAQEPRIDLKKPAGQGGSVETGMPDARQKQDGRGAAQAVASAGGAAAAPSQQNGNSGSASAQKGGNVKLVLAVIAVLAVLGAGAFFGIQWVNSDHGEGETTPAVQGNVAEAGLAEGVPGTDSVSQNDENTGEEADNTDLAKDDKELFQNIDDLAQKAQDELDAEAYTDAHKDSKKALQDYLRVAEKNNLKMEAQARIANSYEIYVASIISYGNVLEGQQDHLAATRYDAIKDMTDPAQKLTDEIKNSGYAIDSEALEKYSRGLAGRYKDFYIRAINVFADSEETGTPWPRDDAWKYASSAYSIQENGKCVLINENNLDDPLRLRYIFCLAWITTKRCEQGIKDGSLDAEGAAEKIQAILKETDYNPLLLQTYVTYANQAGMGGIDKYQRAYDMIIQKIKEQQNLTIEANNSGAYTGDKVDLRYFRYFNDLDGEEEYLVDSVNGTSAATRAWIRDNIPDVLE